MVRFELTIHLLRRITGYKSAAFDRSATTPHFLKNLTIFGISTVFPHVFTNLQNFSTP